MQTRLRPARLAIAGLAALISAGDPVGATNRRSQGSVDSIERRAAGEPAMAIVSLHSRRITVASTSDQAALMLLRKDST